MKTNHTNISELAYSKPLFTLALVVLLLTASSNAHSYEKKFQGFWGESIWTYMFSNDGTFQRTELYHFGTRTIKGTYKISGQLISVSVDTPIRQPDMGYRIDKQGLLIDLNNGYDFKALDGSGPTNYASQQRENKPASTTR